MTIYNFHNTIEFLRFYLQNQPKKGRGGIKKIAELLNVDSSQVSQVLSGKKIFTEEQALKITNFCSLNELESDYFICLIKIERAGTIDLKKYYLKKKEQIKLQSLNLKERINHGKILTDVQKNIFYSSHLYSAVRLFTSVGNGKTHLEISDRFKISKKRTQEIIDFLLSAHLIQKNENRFSLGTQQTHVEKGSPYLLRHHLNWRMKSLGRTENLSDQEMQFTGPVSVSLKEFDTIREILIEAIQKSLNKVKTSEPDDVACLLIDWFWLDK